MMKLTRKHVVFILLTLVLLVALISWFAFGWKSVPGGVWQLLGVVIPTTLGAMADFYSIWKDSQQEKSRPIVQVTQKVAEQIEQSGDGTNIAAQQVHVQQTGGTRIEVAHVEHWEEAPRGPGPDRLPRRPNRGILVEPGPLPPGSRVLYSRNARFTGREQDLLALAEVLLYADEAGNVGVTQAAAATGLGGIGKTQLAVEFCYRYGRYFEGVHWIAAASGELEAEIVECGRVMGVRPWPDEQPERLAATLRAWAHSRRRLVVLDNLEDPQALREWLPRLAHCCVLVTARRAAWPPELDLRQHPLGLFSRAESLALLRELAPRLHALADADLDGLADRLGDLPLAIDLAGRYLADRERLSPEEYRAELDREENLLDNSSLLDWVQGSPTAHETSLAATFMASWRQLRVSESASRQARMLFLQACWCAPNLAIPLEMLEDAAGGAGEAFDRALARLYGLGLLERAQGGPLLHPLLAAFGRRLPWSGAFLKPLAASLCEAMGSAIVSGLPENFAPLRGHAEQAVPLAEVAGLEMTAELWGWLGRHLETIADHSRAWECYQRALRIDEAAHGPEHPEVAIDVNNLGSVLQDQGDLAGARECYQRALRIDETAYGLEHSRVAIDVNNLGSVLHDQGDLAGARECFERALRIDEAACGLEHPDVAIDVNNLGRVLHDQGDLAGARECIERALQIDEAVYGSQHPRVATCVNNLGRVLHDQDNLTGARECYRRALRIDEAAHGSQHPKVARDVNNLGRVLHDQDNLTGARECYRRALRIDEAAHGSQHPKVARDVNNLGRVLHDQGDLAKARECYQWALRIDEAAYGPQHPKVAIRINNLGRVLHEQGDLTKARECFERALRIDEAAYGPQHPKVAIRINNLGRVLHDQGDLAGARECYQRALRIFERFLPPDHPNLRIVRENLASLDPS